MYYGILLLAGATSSPQRSVKFKIKKPWTACLGENKKSWKEQAARDAELRAQQQQQQQSDDAVTTQE